MKRLRRIVLNSLTALSLLMCVATVALWMRSYRYCEYCAWAASSGDFTDGPLWRLDRYARAARGRITFASEYGEWRGAFSGSVGDSNPLSVWERELGPGNNDPQHNPATTWGARKAGFALFLPRKQANDPSRYVSSSTERVYSVTIPLWAPTTVFCLLPVWQVVRAMRRRAKTRAPHCSCCSYDLTANASGVCPECGTKVGEVT